MYFFNVSKMSKSGCKLVMFCRKVKDAEGKGSRAQFVRHPLGDFRHPLKFTLPPPGRNPETAPGGTNLLFETFVCP